MTHFVYPYKIPQDKEFGWELMMSFRSLYENFEGDFDITLIGDIPDWVDQTVVKCIPFNNEDVNTQRQGKINQKIIKATELYDEFVVMNDDIYFMGKITDEELRIPRKIGDLSFKEKNIFAPNSFTAQLKNTYFKLKDFGKQYQRNFVSHCPHYYKSEIIKEIQKNFNFSPLGFPKNVSVVFENLYFNYIGAEGVSAEDFRCGCWGPNCEYKERKILNHDERGAKLNSWIKDLLQETFPKKCRAEKLYVSIAPHQVVNNLRVIESMKGNDNPVESWIKIDLTRVVLYREKKEFLKQFDLVLPISIKQNLIAWEQLGTPLKNMILVPKEIVDICDNKGNFIKKIRKIGLEKYLPETYNSPSEVKSLPIFKKPKVGINYEGIEILKDIPEFFDSNFTYQETLIFDEEYSQNFISNGERVEFSNTYVYLEKKRPFTIDERIELYFNGKYKQVQLTKEIEAQLTELIKGIGYKGPGNINFIYKDGLIKVFEINPRFGATLMFDFKEAIWKFYELLGEDSDV